MLDYRVALMPHYRNRPGYRLVSTSLTTHNTANPDADAADHARYLASSAAPHDASWHICVDDIEAVLSIPLNEQAWHTGTNAGNTTSIGIEVCEFTDPARQDAAIDNAARLIGDMLDGTAHPAFHATHLSVGQVRTHQSWMQYGTSGKYCPRVILTRGWAGFISLVGFYAGTSAAEQGGGIVAYTTLSEGMVSDLVGELQERLRRTGAAVIPSNNYFDARTAQLVRNFQTSAGLPADSVVGPDTWNKLIEVTQPLPAPLVDITAKAAKYDRIAAIVRTAE